MSDRTLNLRNSLMAAVAASTLAIGANAQTILIDLGPLDLDGTDATTPSPDANGNDWNNFSPGQFVRLADTTGAFSASTIPDGIGFGATTGVGTNGSANPGGLSNPDAGLLGDLAIVTATQDYVFVGAGGTLSFELSSVDPTQSFNFRFFGSRTSTETRETQYTVTGAAGAQTATLITSGTNIGSDGMSFGNDNMIAEISGVSATAGGIITVDIEVSQGGFGYLNLIEIEVVPDVAVTITAQPESSVVDAGATLVFSAGAESTGSNLGFQWQRDGVDLVDDMRISGATTSTLSVSGASLDDVGEYALVASDSGVTAESITVIGAVRGTPLGIADFNNDGSLNFFDVLSFLATFDAAQ